MITTCNDMGIVKQFMLLPEIRRYSEEYGSGEQEFTCGKREVWITYDIDGELAGLINMHVETGSMCQFHPYILKKYRLDYNNMLLAFFKWFDETMPPEAIKLNAIIPTLFKPAIKAGKAVGGTVEGVDRLSYRTKNRIYDRILLGITREEMRNGQSCQ